MKLYIDADGCPVVNIAVNIAVRYGVSVVVVADTAHYFDFDNELVSVIIVSKGNDSADFAILSRCARGDVVITQDYALAALCLTRGTHPINQNGKLYTDDNIDDMLMRRHINRQIRLSGGKTAHAKKRVKAQNESFASAFESLIAGLLKE
jgi:hypothetical protein